MAVSKSVTVYWQGN